MAAADPPESAALGSHGLLISAVGQQAMTAFRLRIEPFGVHPRGFAVLSMLHAGGGRSQRELSVALRLPASRMVTIVNALEAGQLVERAAHPLDGRAHLVRLTSRGRRATQEMLTAAAGLEAELTSGLTDAERAQLRDLLQRVGANLAEADPEAIPRVW